MCKHMVSVILASIAGAVFRILATEWFFLLLAIFLAITFEIVNSAIENVVDLTSNYRLPMLAKNAEDMVAGAVLAISGCATLIGLIIFIPEIIALILGE